MNHLVIIIKQGPVVQRVDKIIHQINHYPVDSVVVVGFVNTAIYPVDSVIHP